MKTCVILTFLAVAVYAAPADEIPIVKQASDINPDGSFEHSFEAGNGIKAEARGVLKPGGPDGDSQEITGSYEYTGEDGVKYSVTYVANENGFQPEGAHIPQIPAYITRALEWIAAHPQKDEPGKKF